MYRLELRHIRSFCAVAGEMHVTRAANRLHIAQPALTQQIRQLERELGTRLIRRTGRGIALTEAGAFFYKESELLLQQLQSVCLQTQEIARGNSGHIVVGVTEASAFYPVLALVFSQYRAQWPAVQLTFRQRQATELAAALRDGQIDVAFSCPLRVEQADLLQDALASEKMLLVVPISHPFAGKRTIPLGALKDEPLIVASHGQVARPFENTLDEACRREGFTPRIVQVSPEYILAMNLAAAGVGLTFVPEYMANMRSDALCSLLVRAKTPLTVDLCFVMRSHEESPLIGNLRKAAVNAFAKPKRLQTLALAGSGPQS